MQVAHGSGETARGFFEVLWQFQLSSGQNSPTLQRGPGQGCRHHLSSTPVLENRAQVQLSGAEASGWPLRRGVNSSQVTQGKRLFNK